MEKWCFVKVAQLTLLSQSIRDFSHSAGQGLTKWLIYYCMSAGGLGTSHCIEWGYPFFPQSNRAYWCQAYLSSWSTPLLLDHFVFPPTFCLPFPSKYYEDFREIEVDCPCRWWLHHWTENCFAPRLYCHSQSAYWLCGGSMSGWYFLLCFASVCVCLYRVWGVVV